MTPLLLSLLISAQVQPPRLRTILPNAATIIVEPMSNARVISVQLWASAKGVEERPETHGLRHLMEHIIALGPNRDLDRRLEMQGGVIRARTYRDATQIEVDVPPGRLDLALNAISEMLQPINVTQDQINTETKIIDQELGLLSDDALLSAAAWQGAYGDDALDPFGDSEVMKNATPMDLEAIHARQFAAHNLSLVIVGPVGLDDATGKARPLLATLQKLDPYPLRQRPDGHPGQATTPGYGEARAATVPGFDSKRTVSALAAALAMASRLDDCYVTYTPTTQNGLIIFGRTDSNRGLGNYVDSLDAGAIAALFEPGKALARGWVNRQLRTPQSVGYIRGLISCQDAVDRPESMLDTINSMTYDDFLKGVKAFRKGAGVEVTGNQ